MSSKQGGIVFVIANIGLEKRLWKGELLNGSILHEMQGQDGDERPHADDHEKW